MLTQPTVTRGEKIGGGRWWQGKRKVVRPRGLFSARRALPSPAQRRCHPWVQTHAVDSRRVSARADHGTMRTQRRANFCRGGGGGRNSGSHRCSCSHRSHFHPLVPSTHLRSEGLLELEDLLDVFRLLFPGGAAFAVLPGHGRLVLWGGRGCVGEGAPGARRAGAGGCEARGCRAGGCGSQGGSGCRRASSSAVSSFALAAAA